MLTHMLGYHVKAQLQQNLTFYLFMPGNTKKAVSQNTARSSKLETKSTLHMCQILTSDFDRVVQGYK